MQIDLADVTYRLAKDADVPALRKLVNAAYSELADLGLNFTGTYQDEAITRERMLGCDVFLAFYKDVLIGTVALAVETRQGEEPVLYLSQFAVAPACKRQGLGRCLLQLADDHARKQGIRRLQLDTAIPAAHLVSLYLREGYEIIDEIHHRGKTYRSYIMEKRIE